MNQQEVLSGLHKLAEDETLKLTDSAATRLSSMMEEILNLFLQRSEPANVDNDDSNASASAASASFSRPTSVGTEEEKEGGDNSTSIKKLKKEKTKKQLTADALFENWCFYLPPGTLCREATFDALRRYQPYSKRTAPTQPGLVLPIIDRAVETNGARYTALILQAIIRQVIKLAGKDKSQPIDTSDIEHIIDETPELKKLFRTQNKMSLKHLCASLVLANKVDYYDASYNLPQELISYMDEIDEERPMKLLLERIEKCLPDLKASLEPTTAEEIARAEKDFKVVFPADLRAFLKWSNGTPDAAPKLSDYLLCGSLADIEEEFSYNSSFPGLFRRLRWLPIYAIDYDFCFNGIDVETGTVLQIDFECQSYSLLALSFRHAIETYVTDLENTYEKVNGQPITKENWAKLKGKEALGKGKLRGKLLTNFLNICTELGICGDD